MMKNHDILTLLPCFGVNKVIRLKCLCICFSTKVEEVGNKVIFEIYQKGNRARIFLMRANWVKLINV